MRTLRPYKEYRRVRPNHKVASAAPAAEPASTEYRESLVGGNCFKHSHSNTNPATGAGDTGFFQFGMVSVLQFPSAIEGSASMIIY